MLALARLTCLAFLASGDLLIATEVEVEPAKLATADASPVDPGDVECGVGLAGIQSTRTFDDIGTSVGRGGRLRQGTLCLGITVGVCEGLDAGASVGYTTIDDDACAPDPDHGDGFTDVTVTAKWRFLKTDGLSLALLPTVVIPTGDHPRRDAIPTCSDHWTVGAAVATTWIVGRCNLGADLGGGYHLTSDDDDPCIIWAVDLAFGFQALDWLQPEVEANWLDSINRGDTPDAHVFAVTGGAQMSLRLGSIAFGVQQAVMGRNTDQTTTLLASWTRSF